jgi:hypothetical protein
VGKSCVKDRLKRCDLQSHGSEVGGVGAASVQDRPWCITEGVGEELGSVQVSASSATLLDHPKVVIIGGVNDGGSED